MIWKREQWIFCFIVIAVTVAVLVCGQLLWRQYAVAKPLDSALRGIQGVESAVWDEAKKGDEGGVATIVLGPVGNLQKTYGEINDAVKQILGKRTVRIVLRDHRTPELESLYHTIHYQIQEAIFTGNFAAMADRIMTQAGAAQVEAEVYVDAGYVYIQLAKGTDGLYMVVPRQPENQEVK